VREGAGYLCSALMGTISHAGMSRQGELVNAHRVIWFQDYY
jgi:hypothetical protein